MTKWQPTDAQVEAAENAYYQPRESEPLADCIRRMLIAAHEAGTPDVAEFEATLTDYRYSISRRAELFQRLIDMYTKAAGL